MTQGYAKKDSCRYISNKTKGAKQGKEDQTETSSSWTLISTLQLLNLPKPQRFGFDLRLKTTKFLHKMMTARFPSILATVVFLDE